MTNRYDAVPASPLAPGSSSGGTALMDAVPLVRLAGIRKSFGDLLVNGGVDLSLMPGEVHALLGENGAGKTTLMRILYGLTGPDGGVIEVNGTPTSIGSPGAAIAAGIGMVTQHFSLVGRMSVTDNLLLSRAGAGRLDRRAGRAMVAAAAQRIGVKVDPDAIVEKLSVGEQQRVEILKALSRDCRVLILDEPTAVLVPQDVEALFASIRLLTAQGMGVLFISHKLGEVSEISDRVSVLRRGKIIDTVPTAGSTPASLAEMMVGRPTVGVRRTDRGEDGTPTVPVGLPDVPATAATAEVLCIRGLRLAGPGKDTLAGIDLAVHAGEIVGVAGVSGNGQTELVQVLAGLTAPTAGTILVNGTDITGASPDAVIAAGLGRITEDRHACVVGKLSVAQNLVMEDLGRFKKGLFLDRKAMRVHAEELIADYSIKAKPDDLIGTLSGGNMQKVLLARALSRDPSALVVAQPTRGLDIGATEFVHRQLLARREAGAGVLLVSEDLEELLALADRIVVIYEGRINGEMPAAGADIERLGLLMAGQSSQSSFKPQGDQKARGSQKTQSGDTA
ncbi:MAG: ABC transporter ATP-binding protein [Nakamurella sp.]